MAVSVAENSAVPLKNEKGVLPLAKGCKAVFLGEFAQHPRYQGGGSSHVNSAKVTCALEQAAVAAAADADVAVIFAGLPERYESEGYDLTTLAYYEPELHDFYAESGTYQICVGASSRDLRLTGLLEWQAAQPLPVHFRSLHPEAGHDPPGRCCDHRTDPAAYGRSRRRRDRKKGR